MIETICRILEKETNWEKKLFSFLNSYGRGHIFWDYCFQLCSCSWLEICVYISLLWIFLHKKDWKEVLLVISLVALVFFLSEWIASGFFKPIFHRLRPIYHPDFKKQVNTFRNVSGIYGFISGHTTNAFGFATFTILVFQNRLYTGIILLFICFVGYSRIYLGVHFISDVLVGIFVGLLVGYLVYNLYKLCQMRFLKTNESDL